MAKKKRRGRPRQKKKTVRKRRRRSFRDPVYKAWRTKVFRRDRYECQICEQSGGSLQAHHIKPVCKWRDLELSVKNGITLCEKCHAKLHKKIGTRVDSAEYIKGKTAER